MKPFIAATVAVLMAGCGGEQPEQRLSEHAAPKATQVAALGDSITAGSPLWDPNPDVRDQIGAPNRESQYELWVERRLGDVSFRNCGVFGERTDQIAARLDACAKGADVLILQGGINDIAQMRRVAGAARNLRAMVVRGKQLGLRVALVEVLPWNNGYPLADLRIRRLNRLIHVIGKDERVPVFPWYRRLEDSERAGRMRADWTIDGDHPTVEGYRRLADSVELP
jgi:lysophospholipase L1-like esterase